VVSNLGSHRTDADFEARAEVRRNSLRRVRRTRRVAFDELSNRAKPETGSRIVEVDL